MPRSRRRIFSLKAYELCFRARSTLPLVAYPLIDMVIKHALARAQRDEKVFLCHDIWNGSHSHQIILSKDAEQCVKFYMEVQKKITDCLKRLLGLDYLSIWEGRPMVALIGNIDDVINRISYLYANPAQDNLETSIEKFPGYSSWKEFNLAHHQSVDFEVSEEVLRLKLPSVPRLLTLTPDPLQERAIRRLLEQRNKEKQSLKRRPNMWMRAFKVREKEVSEINNRIIKKLRRREHLAALLRRLSNKQVMGRSALKKQPILKSHTPKKRERKPFVLSSSTEFRVWFIQQFKEFCATCAECYQEWRRSNWSVEWPPGAFKPPLPPNVNLLHC